MSRKIFLALAILATVPLVISPASADVAAFETFTATVGESSIALGGKAILKGPETIVATSPASGGTRLPGTDLRSASITRVGGSQLKFSLKVGDLPPGAGGTPEVVHYWWEFEVVKGTSASEFALQAWRSSTAADATCGVIFACPAGEVGAAKPRFQLSTCAPDPQTGNRSCSAQGVAGSLEGDTFSWTVPVGLIGATGGADIMPSGTVADITAAYGASGISWNTAGTLGKKMPWEGWTYSAPTLRFGIASADTPDEAVETTLTPATFSLSTGNFTGAVAKPTEPGSYKVVAKVCYGADNCALASQLFTI